MERMTAMPFDDRVERAAARHRLGAYLTGTLSVLDVGGWETHEVSLGLVRGREDRVVAYYGDEGEEAYRLTLLISRDGLSYLIEKSGDERGVQGYLAPGVPIPTPQEAREWYLNDTVPKDAPFRFIVAEHEAEVEGDE